MKKIAVINGASSGMGRRFAETVDTFDRFDDGGGVIARHEKALAELQTGCRIPSMPSGPDGPPQLPDLCRRLWRRSGGGGPFGQRQRLR